MSRDNRVRLSDRELELLKFTKTSSFDDELPMGRVIANLCESEIRSEVGGEELANDVF